MVTTGRQIKTKQDRYGSFEKNYDRTVDTGLTTQVTINSVSTTENVATQAHTATPTKVKTSVTGTNKNLTISDTYKDSVKKSKTVAGVASKEKVTTRNVVMIVAYCLVVVALIAGIALNATALTSLSSQNANVATEITSLKAEYASLSADLATLSDPTRVQTLASNMNLSQTSANVVSMNVPNLLPATETAVQTNWFNQMCGTVSGLIGG